MNVLLVSEDYIKTNSNLNENVWGEYLLPAIKTSQDMGLQSIIGSCLYNALIDMVSDSSITASTNTQYKVLLDDYVQDYLMYATITDLVPIIGVKLANLGVVVSNDEHVQNLSETERNNIQGYYEKKTDFYAKRLQSFLNSNKDSFPELKCGCECDGTIKPNLDSAASTGIFLGGLRSPMPRIIKKKH